MQMFVANTTQQFHEFVYRVPEGKKVIIQTIRPGGQIRVAANRGDLSQQDIDSIFDQHRKYGLIWEREVGARSAAGSLCPLIAALDKPVNMEKAIAQYRFNMAALSQQGQASRESAAVALNEQIETNISMSGRPDVLNELTFEVEEVKGSQVINRAGRAEDEAVSRMISETAPIGSGIHVDKHATGGASGRRRDAPLPPRRRQRKAV